MASNLGRPAPIKEIECRAGLPLDFDLLQGDEPWVARGLVGHWPVVKDNANGQETLAYLQSFCSNKKTSAFLAEAEHRGRLFYNDDFDGFNFVQLDTTLEAVFAKLSALESDPLAPTLYVGSTNIDQALPGFRRDNTIDVPDAQPLTSLWVGNKSRVAAHFDYPRNLACCIAGQRRFTLFPPEQVENLYVGPWDLTPAGQPISLVDTQEPDLDRFPRFARAWESAQSAELQPGDAIYIPGMWWHQVESLSAINGLVNYWWSETPAVYGAPMDAFNHALLSIKQLPPAQRRAWKSLFDTYVFNESEEALAHIPEHARGKMAPLHSEMARRLRAELINRLKR